MENINENEPIKEELPEYKEEFTPVTYVNSGSALSFAEKKDEIYSRNIRIASEELKNDLDEKLRIFDPPEEKKEETVFSKISGFLWTNIKAGWYFAVLAVVLFVSFMTWFIYALSEGLIQ